MFNSFEVNSSKNSSSSDSSLDWIEQSIQQMADELEHAPGSRPNKVSSHSSETDQDKVLKIVIEESKSL